MKGSVIHFGQAIPTVGGAVGLNTLCGLGPNGVRSTVLAEVTCKTCLRSGGLEWAQRENAKHLQQSAAPGDRLADERSARDALKSRSEPIMTKHTDEELKHPTGAHMIPAAKAITEDMRRRAREADDEPEAEELANWAEVIDCLGLCIGNEAARADRAEAKERTWIEALMKSSADTIAAEVGVCAGCGTSRTAAELKASGHVSCCPERKMLTAKQWAERCEAAEARARTAEEANTTQAERIKELEGQQYEMRRALEVSKETFALYADLHHEKRTPEGDEKAARNLDMAEMCERALSATPPAAPSLPADRIAELFSDLIPHLQRRSYGYVITSVLPVDRIVEEALGLLAPFADRVAGEEEEADDYTVIDDRIHPSREAALDAAIEATAPTKKEMRDGE